MRRALLVALAALACRRAPPPTRPANATSPAPQAPTPATGAPLAPYRVIQVRGGGVIRGVVRFEGPRPETEDFAVGAIGNPMICGQAQPAEALVVGAGGGVANTVLSLSDITAGRAPSATQVVVDQTSCRYVPHVTAVSTGVELRFTNSDSGTIHNVHAFYGYDEDDNWFNATTPFGVATSRVVQRTGVARLTCDAGHFWMLGYVVAFAHPYFAVTDETGRFEIRDVPPGTYTLHAWHEGMTIARREGTGRRHFAPPVESSRRVTVPSGGSADVAITLRRSGFDG